MHVLCNISGIIFLIFSKPVRNRCSSKYVMFLKISQSLQDKTIARVPFLIKRQQTTLFNSLFHNVEKWPNILLKSCGVHTARFLKYVWPFFNIFQQRLWHRCFAVNFAKFLRTLSFYRTPLGDCFWNV